MRRLSRRRRTPTPPASSSSASSSSANSDSSLISANDFLTLLVTEMQNQDPTADTDPNEYINQLVQVNSLEQLIDINQTLTTAFTPTTPAAPPRLLRSPLSQHQALPILPRRRCNPPQAEVSQPSQPPCRRRPGHRKQPQFQMRPGTSLIPTASPSALRVAHSLSGQPHAPPLKRIPAPLTRLFSDRLTAARCGAIQSSRPPIGETFHGQFFHSAHRARI